jgi:hypothetical protein
VRADQPRFRRPERIRFADRIENDSVDRCIGKHIQRIRQQSGGIRKDASYDFKTANKRGNEFRFRRPYFLISANAEFVGLRM